MHPASYWIEHLQLQPHPEGGWYRETYRAHETLAAAHLPARYGGERSVCTAIYFLLAAGQISALHRLHSDELWHYHAGGPLTITVIAPDGALSTLTLGADPARGEVLQAVIPAGTWFGAQLAPSAAYILLGCTVAPGFAFADFELARRADLLAAYPQHAARITALTHPE